MSSISSPAITTSAYPEPTEYLTDSKRPSTSSIHSSASSISSTASESEQPSTHQRQTRLERPRSGHRQKSSSIIIPKEADVFQKERPDYPPDDARAMSPRRNGHDIEILEQGVRNNLKRQALTLQSSLLALAEKIDEVKSDHDRLETENRFLQDYIGGLTRTMSQETVGRTSSVRKKGRK